MKRSMRTTRTKALRTAHSQHVSGRSMPSSARSWCFSSRLAVSLVLLIVLVGVPGAAAAETDDQAVHAAIADFHNALNAMFRGELAPMEKVWSHADDVTYMGPTGDFLVGWEAVRESWAAQAAMKLGGAVRAEDVHVTVGQSLAIVSNIAVGENTGPDGEPFRVDLRTTSLFRKEAGRWKMIGHHTDLIPELQTP